MNASSKPAPPAQETPTPALSHGLHLEEPLLFEVESDACGVDLPQPEAFETRLGGLEREGEIGLPCLSEPQVMRHYSRLARQNYSIDDGIYPLGSCTMKHNPRLNEKVARLPGFADIHPLQPQSSVPGALALMESLSEKLRLLTGMPVIAMTPRAGAHGELCGMMAIRSALQARGGADAERNRILAPESAHGTNPATAAMLGFEVEPVPANAEGEIDFAAVEDKLDESVAAIMITNPNTCGLFETRMIDIADAIHKAGGYLYCDGANFNAILGRVRPGDLGVDAMHINLHKTFSTPHGGGGPGAGPVALSERLGDFAPLPCLFSDKDGLRLLETKAEAERCGVSPFGRLSAFHGQMGMFTRALTYILSHGGDGLRQASGDAVLNANYLRVCLQDVLRPAFDRVCMHEVLFTDATLLEHGVSTLDFAKAMIDKGVHPMTMYFPLVVSGAMLMEPTESESKASLDGFIAIVRELAETAASEQETRFAAAPRYAPRKRIDETAAARKPRLAWKTGG